MEIQLQTIISACIVYLGLTSVQPRNENTEQSLFSSIAKYDTHIKKNGISLKILKQGVSKERQVFDTMKEELRLARNRNDYKKRNSVQRSKAKENMVVVKRETHEEKLNLALSRRTTSERNADRALYKKFKDNTEYFANITLVEGVQTRLTEENPEDERPAVMLYDYGYLTIKRNSAEETDGFRTLHFPSLEAEIAMMTDLIYGAELEDSIIGDALSIMRKSFAREPPSDEGFTYIMQGLNTIIRRLPYVRFPDNMFYKLVVLSALRCCGLETKFGDTPVDGGIVYCDHIQNNTRLLFEMEFEHHDARKFWESDFKNRLRIIVHSRRPRRMMLATLITFDGGEQRTAIHDWYGQYLSIDPNDNYVLVVEYKKPT